MKLEIDSRKVREFCRRRGISKLEAFGSVLTDSFRADSDVDLLATLRSDAHPTLLDWAAMHEELAALFGRNVDLVSRRALERSKNEFRKRSILNSVELLYVEG
jgi:predicted nucleotidyltransferase